MTDDPRQSPFGAKQRGPHWLVRLYELLTLPFTIHFLLSSPRIDPAYKLSALRRFGLGLRMYRNTRRVWTGVSFRAHLAMAVKLLEVPASERGVVVECGCFRGGTTANLSLVCDVVGRDLYVYDSFEGLPAAKDGDQYANPAGEGFLSAGLEQVRAHVAAHGAVDRCTFVKGWFEDTLPGHEPPIVLMFLDVDYQASLTDCIVNLWPKLTERGYCFIDEFVYNDYCALFWSERFWNTHFDRTPPGLTGSGTGVSVGGFYLGGATGMRKDSEFLRPDSVAYTRKDWSGHWGYYPGEEAVASGTEGAPPC
jgi:hypothetical protein